MLPPFKDVSFDGQRDAPGIILLNDVWLALKMAQFSLAFTAGINDNASVERVFP